MRGTCDCRPVAAVTSLTFQNSEKVFGSFHQTAESLRAQILPLVEEFRIAAVKIGMLPTRELVLEVARLLGETKIRLSVTPVAAQAERSRPNPRSARNWSSQRAQASGQRGIHGKRARTQKHDSERHADGERGMTARGGGQLDQRCAVGGRLSGQLAGGGVEDWDVKRRVLSRWGCGYARLDRGQKSKRVFN